MALENEPARATEWEPLTRPDRLRELVPRTADSAVTVARARASIQQVLNGTDDRLLVIVGPCSIHEQEAAVEYAGRLSELADTLSDDLLVVMRTYFEKPRTSVGWPGLALSPDLHGPPDPERGFRLARQLMAEITDMGVPVAVEWLTPVAPAYFEDLVAWGSIGARSVENQTYRQMASSLAMPIGMKNRTDGAVHPAVDAVRAAARRQAFLGIAPDGSAALTRTAGTPTATSCFAAARTDPITTPRRSGTRKDC